MIEREQRKIYKQKNSWSFFKGVFFPSNFQRWERTLLWFFSPCFWDFFCRYDLLFISFQKWIFCFFGNSFGALIVTYLIMGIEILFYFWIFWKYYLFMMLFLCKRSWWNIDKLDWSPWLLHIHGLELCCFGLPS